ncbi:MAG: hypothetical protein P8Y46_04450 [Sulfurovaceae bacterium]
MEDVWVYILFLIFFELFEIAWQYSDTLYQILEKAYRYYSKSIFVFLLMHPSFYFILFVVLATGRLNVSMIIILTLKIFDMFTKIELVRKLFIEQKLSVEMESLLHKRIYKIFFLSGILIYVPLLYIALN